MKDIRQTPKYAKYLKSIGWDVENIGSGAIFIKKIPIIGSVIKIQRPDNLVESSELWEVCKRRRVVAIYIEPKNEEQREYFLNSGFKRSKTPSLPSKTIHIGITKSKKDLLSEMHHKTRYNIGLSKRKGVEVNKSKHIVKFANFWQESAKRRRMYLPQKKEIVSIYKAFGSKAVILDAVYSNKVVASVMILSTGKTSYYMYSASTSQGNRVFAPSLLVWESLIWSKKKKLKTFDFEGIYDDRFPLKRWRGFSRFKRSFGGEEVKYPPPLKKYYFPF
jgi:lipid II:glycine glycyltransferase (peptidoglycan interpeptide bridge formation enzyme)